MTRKAAWILILLVALTAISASVAFAANAPAWRKQRSRRNGFRQAVPQVS